MKRFAYINDYPPTNLHTTLAYAQDIELVHVGSLSLINILEQLHTHNLGPFDGVVTYNLRIALTVLKDFPIGVYDADAVYNETDGKKEYFLIFSVTNFTSCHTL